MQSVELYTARVDSRSVSAGRVFKHLALVEVDEDSCLTIQENKRRRVEEVHSWPLFNCDVRQFDFDSLPEGIELLAAGVPCQPFSIGGKHRGHSDERNLFPETNRCHSGV